MRPLRLRSDVSVGPLELGHADNMLAWMQDPEVSSNVGLTTTPSLERTRAWIENALRGTSVRPYAILLRSQHVGNVVLDQHDPNLESARLSVYVGARDARSCGVGVTAMYLALRDTFLERGLHKVWLTVHVRNSAAIRTYTSLGFQVEGVLRDGFRLGGERLAALYMGSLREDFLKLETEQV